MGRDGRVGQVWPDPTGRVGQVWPDPTRLPTARGSTRSTRAVVVYLGPPGWGVLGVDSGVGNRARSGVTFFTFFLGKVAQKMSTFLGARKCEKMTSGSTLPGRSQDAPGTRPGSVLGGSWEGLFRATQPYPQTACTVPAI
jgi:hypothetical protein